MVVEAMMATVTFIWVGGKKDYICIFPQVTWEESNCHIHFLFLIALRTYMYQAMDMALEADGWEPISL